MTLRAIPDQRRWWLNGLLIQTVFIATILALQAWFRFGPESSYSPAALYVLFNLAFVISICVVAVVVVPFSVDIRVALMLFAISLLLMFGNEFHTWNSGLDPEDIRSFSLNTMSDGNKIFRWNSELDAEDLRVFSFWALSVGSIYFVSLRQPLPSALRVALLLAVMTQGIALMLDLFEDSQIDQQWPTTLLSWIYIGSTVFSIAAYQLSFQYLIKATSSASEKELFQRFLLQAFRFFHSGTGSSLSVAWSNVEFGLWRLRYPQSSFAEFYAGSIARRLKRGKAHKTLGKRVFLRNLPFFATDEYSYDAFSKRGWKQFLELRGLGVQPGDTCVDYGCGSLRIGQHLIEYLEPSKYWGLDVIDTFYNQGLELLPPKLVAEKQPRFRVISPATLGEVRACRPDYVFSTAVLKHVPPRELNQFLGNVLQLRATRTVIAVFFDESEEVVRTTGKNWAYDAKTLVDCVRMHDPSANVQMLKRSMGRSKGKFIRNKMILLIEQDKSDVHDILA